MDTDALRAREEALAVKEKQVLEVSGARRSCARAPYVCTAQALEHRKDSSLPCHWQQCRRRPHVALLYRIANPMHARACACARQALAKLESSAKDTPIFIVDAFTAPGAAPCLTGKSLRRHLAIIPCACAQQARASFALASPECALPRGGGETAQATRRRSVCCPTSPRPSPSPLTPGCWVRHDPAPPRHLLPRPARTRSPSMHRAERAIQASCVTRASLWHKVWRAR